MVGWEVRDTIKEYSDNAKSTMSALVVTSEKAIEAGHCHGDLKPAHYRN